MSVSVFALLFFAARWMGRDYERVSLGKTYYLLVRLCDEETAVSVSTQVYLSGGAGYYMKAGGKDCVVLSCYYKETDARLVQASMERKGVETQIIECACADFSLTGRNAAYAEAVAANAATANDNAKLLFETANKLERTEISQEEARAALRGVTASLSGLRKGNEGKFFERWNAALNSAEKKGREIASGIIFAKDLRYLQVQLTAAVVNADVLFA